MLPLSVLFLSNLPTSVSAPSSSSSSDCALFAINGSSSAKYYFTHYRFYDFRNIANPLLPPVGQSSGLAASHATNDSSWLLDWSPRNQAQGAANRVSIPVDYLPSNVYVSPANESSSDYSSYLTLATTKLKNDTQSAAEIGFLPSTNIVYVSLRVLARVSGTPGAVGGIFSYCDDESETDIEILTHDPVSQVRYSNQPTTNLKTGAPIAGATSNESIPSGNWEQWNVHRLDWLPGQTAKWADGVRLQTSTVNVQNATAGSQVFLDVRLSYILLLLILIISARRGLMGALGVAPWLLVAARSWRSSGLRWPITSRVEVLLDMGLLFATSTKLSVRPFLPHQVVPEMGWIGTLGLSCAWLFS